MDTRTTRSITKSIMDLFLCVWGYVAHRAPHLHILFYDVLISEHTFHIWWNSRISVWSPRALALPRDMAHNTGIAPIYGQLYMATRGVTRRQQRREKQFAFTKLVLAIFATLSHSITYAQRQIFYILRTAWRRWQSGNDSKICKLCQVEEWRILSRSQSQ